MTSSKNRERETILVLNSLSKGKSIDIYGAKGIGKTYFLLNNIIEKTRCKFNIVYISLTETNSLTGLLNLIAKSYNDQYGDRLFFKFRENFHDNIYDTRQLIIQFSASLYSAIEDREIVFCFDNTEVVPLKIWEEFEDNILRFYLEEELDSSEGKLRIITTGQKRMKWNFFLMRKQVEYCRLELLDRRSSKDMIFLLAKQEQIDFDEKYQETIINDIYSLTKGHPNSIKLVIQHWEKLQANAERYQKGISTLLNKYVQPEFIDQVNGLVKKEHDPNSLSSFLQHLAPLRFISTKILRETLINFSSFSSFYSNKNPFFFNKLHRILQDEHLLDWSEERERYEFPAIVRHILLEDLKLKDENDGKTFIEYHQEITASYKRLIKQNFIDRHHDFVEQLYHIVSWQDFSNIKGNDTHNTEETVKNKIEEYLEQYEEDAVSLRTLLENDDDLSNLNWKKIFNSLKK